jgi:hypothetical protein
VSSHDPSHTPNPAFPNLTPTNHRIIGPASARFYCIAWACGDTQRWWQPGPNAYWPIPRDPALYWTLDNLIAALTTVGFVVCADGLPEPGFERVVLYASSASEYTHVARQLPFGTWTSKLGKWELIEHDTPECVAGGVYGEIVGFMKRPLPAG